MLETHPLKDNPELRIFTAELQCHLQSASSVHDIKRNVHRKALPREDSKPGPSCCEANSANPCTSMLLTLSQETCELAELHLVTVRDTFLVLGFSMGLDSRQLILLPLSPGEK